jgi:hypothetical protein
MAAAWVLAAICRADDACSNLLPSAKRGRCDADPPGDDVGLTETVDQHLHVEPVIGL